MKGALAALAFAVLPVPAAGCALELILAVDVSGSVDPQEYGVQMGGLAMAFEDPEVAGAVERLGEPVMAAVTQWSGTSRQKLVVGWTRLTDSASLAGFSAAIRAVPRAYENYSTAVGEALNHASDVSADNPVPCRRKVIDVSGDGVSNEGRAPRHIADALAELGYTINALVIRGADPDPLGFYRDHVIAGPGAFLEVAEDFDAYPAAILRKLLREIEAPLAVGMAD